MGTQRWYQRYDGRSISGEASVKNHRRDGGEGISGELPSLPYRGTATEASAESHPRDGRRVISEELPSLPSRRWLSVGKWRE